MHVAMLRKSRVNYTSRPSGQSGSDLLRRYGFKNVITPGDLITAYPALWPFANRQLYTAHARPLPFPIHSDKSPKHPRPTQNFRVAAILVFHDPRDWALDIQIIIDLLLSQKGYLGTLSSNNGDPHMANRGYQQDGQPALWFSNPDLFWASEYHLDRLGQGAFLRALSGVWEGVTGGEENKVQLLYGTMGKPSTETYSFAEQKLIAHQALSDSKPGAKHNLENVYMIGGTSGLGVYCTLRSLTISR